MVKVGSVMANRKIYAVAMTILQTMTEVFPKEHLEDQIMRYSRIQSYRDAA